MTNSSGWNLGAATGVRLMPISLVLRKVPVAPLLLLLAACAPLSTPAPSPRTVCADIAAIKAAPDAAALLARIDPHSALGILWADVQSGCVDGVPIAGVNPSWTQQVWAMAKAIIPSVLPQLMPLLIELL